MKRGKKLDQDNYKLELGIIWDNKPDIDFPYITKLKARFNHTYIIGKSGMGKSTLMENMADYDIKFGLPVIYIDPKGDSVNKLTNNKNYQYISFQHPVKINPLRRRGYKIDTLIREFTDVMDIMVTETTINPEATTRMKQILTKAIKGFREKDRNLQFLNKFLSFQDIRKLYDFEDKAIKDWFKEIEDEKKSGYKLTSEYKTTMSGIASRLSQFIENDEMSQFLIEGENEFDLGEVIEQGKSLLINTSTGDDDNQKFLSALFLHSIYSYIRENKIEKPLMVYLDEFQTVVNSSFPKLLQYGRSCQVGFTMAHHDFQAIDLKILSAIFGISSSFISFNCGDTEAKRLAEIVRVPSSKIMDLPEHHAYSRLGTSNSFFKTFPPLENSFQPPIEELPEVPVYNFLSNDWIVV
jgi:hypothetical protein